jgi:hypothetical protein
MAPEQLWMSMATAKDLCGGATVLVCLPVMSLMTRPIFALIDIKVNVLDYKIVRAIGWEHTTN